ncbi:hypothetical protein Nepgr_011831 [Nepenthes gracilis]|uniref:Clp R domain-containing protein n=1 Tax=Nepenthes gracilis TaxID=150966 RepID=A0AAD3XMR1_NEPGR|nr:hypothetical protein Nepgr_011831 [Nepenthes gracilis]
MRSGGCTPQQSLTPEAEIVLKQAVNLASQRGHAQVTPIHVAKSMLAPATSLLRSACLQSHSHPLQCRALELCFNVALNRRPTASASNPILGLHSHKPTVSNALIAAFKRAQTHHRCGSIENRQQPILATKIDLEQLIISILDDPSVSRIMREAGFSSTLVKRKVEEHALSMELSSQTHPPNINKKSKNSSAQAGLVKYARTGPFDQDRNDDISIVIDGLINPKKRNLVIIGECISTLEAVVNGVMDKVEKGEVPEALRAVKFVPFSLLSFAQLSGEEADQRVEELKHSVKGYLESNQGVILYVGDLKLSTELKAFNEDHQQCRNHYCPIIELQRLGLGHGEGGKLWILTIATFQTYMRCKSCHPNSLESTWDLHVITIPTNSLNLSLIPNSDLRSPSMASKKANSRPNWLLLECCSMGAEEKHCNSGADSSAKLNIEAYGRESCTCNSEPTTSSLPSWLQRHKDGIKRQRNNDEQESVSVQDLCKKWSSAYNSAASMPAQSTISFSSSASEISDDGRCFDLYPTHHNWPVPDPIIFRDHENANETREPTFTMSVRDHDDHLHAGLYISSSNPNSSPNSTSSSDVMEIESAQRFSDYNSENLKILCNALEKKVPWQRETIPVIANAILNYRSGSRRRKGNTEKIDARKETWLFFEGLDRDGKQKIGRELARLIFGSESKFFSISRSVFSSPMRADSMEVSRNKRRRDERWCNYGERFAEAVSQDPHRVFFIEDIQQMDYSSQMGIKNAIERGGMIKSNGEEINLNDAIIILSCESSGSRPRACSPSIKQRVE